MGEGGRGTSSSPFPQGELWGKGKPAGELAGELYIGEGEGGTLGKKQLSRGVGADASGFGLGWGMSRSGCTREGCARIRPVLGEARRLTMGLDGCVFVRP